MGIFLLHVFIHARVRFFWYQDVVMSPFLVPDPALNAPLEQFVQDRFQGVLLDRRELQMAICIYWKERGLPFFHP